ncbi:MAG: hypothetical protein BGO43_15570 [Gammaproteobacteria bacterium 39-13]|nr:MAG: hypothetical protein BGO43_15570 [Gammaproteobacteria bacterium 39-13]
MLVVEIQLIKQKVKHYLQEAIQLFQAKHIITYGQQVKQIQNDGMGPRDTHFVDINEWKELIKKSQEKQ